MVQKLRSSDRQGLDRIFEAKANIR